MAGTTITPGRIAPKGSDTLAAADTASKAVVDLEFLRVRLAAVALSSGALAIHGSASALAKNGTAFAYLAPPSATTTGAAVYGVLAANTDTAAFSGSVTNGKFNVFVHSLSDDGTGTQTLHTRMGTEGATRAAVVFPTIPAGEVVYGFTEINPTGTGPFVGGTTALDDATVTPNAAYRNVVGPALSVSGGQAASSLTAAKIFSPHTNAAITYVG